MGLYERSGKGRSLNEESKLVVLFCPRICLVASLPIYLVDQLPSTPVSLDVLNQYLERPVGIHIRRPTAVWSNQYVWCVPERVIGRQRLRVSHVECSTANLTLLKRDDESLLIYALPTCNIGHVCTPRIALVQQLELGCGEEVRSLFATIMSAIRVLPLITSICASHME